MEVKSTLKHKKGDYIIMETNKIYTVEETAKILKISVSELRKIMTLRQITFFEVGEDTSKRKIKRFRESDISKYINRHLIEDIESSDYNV